MDGKLRNRHPKCSVGKEISLGAMEMRLHLGSFGKIGAVRDRECSVGKEISWGAVEMRLHLGSFGEIEEVRDRE
jgi:hypothetical protein